MLLPGVSQDPKHWALDSEGSREGEVASSFDREMMKRALLVARGAAQAGEVPVAALVTQGGKVLAESANRTVADSDPTAHAEVLTIRAAARKRGDWRLNGTTLYVTLEPCAMCAGAIVLARISRVVFGAMDPKAGMGGSLANLLNHPRLNHRCSVAKGVLAKESAHLLMSFFGERRIRR